MNKSQFVDELAKRFDGNRKVAQHALDSVVDVITRSVASGERVVITGFGAFERGVREAGTARNPRTGAVVKTPRRFVPKFRPGSDLRQFVNDARAMQRRVVESLAVVPATAVSAARAAATGKAPSTGRAAATGRSAAKSAAKKTTVKKTTTAKATATKSTAKKSTAKKSTARKATAKTAPKKTTAAVAKKAPAKKTATKKTTTARTAATSAKKS